MPIDYMETMGTIGAVTAKHPRTSSLAMQTYSEWKARLDDIKNVVAKYQETVAKAKAEGRDLGMLDQLGIVQQLAAQNPWAVSLLIRTLSAWQTRIPDGVEILTEFQESSAQAYKT